MEGKSWRVWGPRPGACPSAVLRAPETPGERLRARGWGAPASLPPPTRPATLQQLPIHRLLSCKLPPPSRSCRCFSLIKGLINTCQSNGPGWEGASALITKTVSQEVFSVWEEHFRLGGMKEPSYKMKRQVVFIWAHASEFTCLISASVPTDA